MGRVRADERFQTVPAFACSTSMHEAVGSSRSQLSASSTIKFHRFASLDRSRSRSSVPAIRGQTQSGLYTLLRPLLPARLCPCLRSLLLLACTASLSILPSRYTHSSGQDRTGCHRQGFLLRSGGAGPPADCSSDPDTSRRTRPTSETASSSPPSALQTLQVRYCGLHTHPACPGSAHPVLPLSCTRRSADLGVGWRRLVPLESRHRRRAR